MERETRTIQTPEGKDLVLKTYLTARERNSIRDVFLKSAKINIGADAEAEKGMSLDGSVMTESQNVMVSLVVTKYGEYTNPDAILNNLLDGNPAEYDFVVAEAGKVKGNLI